MKKRINLLIYHNKYRNTQIFFQKIRKLIYLFLFFSLILISFLLVVLFSKKNQLNRLIEEKNQLQNEVYKEKETEISYKIFANKFNQLKEILKSDVDFYPSYQLINDSLKNASTSAFLESIEIEKNKRTNFTISIKDFNELINFLNFVEEKKFLSNFNQLVLKSLALQQNKDFSQMSENYQLRFAGRFKQ